MYNEFVVEMIDGTRDWIDPVVEVTQDDEFIYVYNGIYTYSYKRSDILKSIVRAYDPETTHYLIGDL